MKKYMAGLITGLLVSLTFTTFAAVVNLIAVPNPFPILVNGIKSDIGAYSIGESTYIKLSDLKAVGVDATFDSKKKQIEIKTKGAPSPDSIAETEYAIETQKKIDGLIIFTKNGTEYVAFDDIYPIVVDINRKESDIINDEPNTKYVHYRLNINNSNGNNKEPLPWTFVLAIEKTGVNTTNNQPIEDSKTITSPMNQTILELKNGLKYVCVEVKTYEEYIKPILNKSLKESYEKTVNKN